jgi:hypothetical protein
MTKKASKREPSEPSDGDTPPWVNDETPEGTAPYTEEELDLLVEGTIESICDTVSWKALVDRVGEEARRELRSRLVLKDADARKVPWH